MMLVPKRIQKETHNLASEPRKSTHFLFKCISPALCTPDGRAIRQRKANRRGKGVREGAVDRKETNSRKRRKILNRSNVTENREVEKERESGRGGK